METAGLILGYIAVIGGLSFAVLPITLHHRHERRKREMEHIERLKALELGRTLPQDEPWWSPLRIGLLIGAVVPVGVFSCVGLASLATGYHEEMWLMAGLVGTAGVVCGSFTVGHSVQAGKVSSLPVGIKPGVEEDAYDVVSSRG
jgi:hypothetical protein